MTHRYLKIQVITGNTIRLVTTKSGDEYLMVMQDSTIEQPSEFFDTEDNPMQVLNSQGEILITVSNLIACHNMEFTINYDEQITDDKRNVYCLIEFLNQIKDEPNRNQTRKRATAKVSS